MRPILYHLFGEWVIISLLISLLGLNLICSIPAVAADFESSIDESLKTIVMENIEPAPEGGYAYRLVYRVGVPIDVYWRFKTDFDNSFLLDNLYILDHRFVERNGNVIITENRYSSLPAVIFKWETTVYPDDYRLRFKLVNQSKFSHRFHYGFIQLTPSGGQTEVTQVAYFDFAGAFFWVHYPWSGGMRSFLKYTAKWEQNMVQRLRDNYETLKKKK